VQCFVVQAICQNRCARLTPGANPFKTAQQVSETVTRCTVLSIEQVVVVPECPTSKTSCKANATGQAGTHEP
jgi:hypothetical protein